MKAKKKINPAWVDAPFRMHLWFSDKAWRGIKKSLKHPLGKPKKGIAIK